MTQIDTTDTADTIESLREALRAALDTPDLDHGRVLELSNRLAQLDQTAVRFTVDAGHVSRLGRELVARQETAVAELIKNAYDADATKVTLTFVDAHRPGGTLLIVDDGTGMTREDLIRGFMRLSATTKVHAPRSSLFRRRRAGRKGIGRFAAQRLGVRLTIVTQVKDAPEALRVTIDWSAFSADRDLYAIANVISAVPKERTHGTTLRIEELREGWSDAVLRRVFRHVAALTPPFPLSKEDAHATAARDVELDSLEVIARDPGFHVAFVRRTGTTEQLVVDEHKMVLEHALAVIDGEVDADGHGQWSVVSRRLRIADRGQPLGPDRDDPRAPYPALRNIRFRAYYFLLESGVAAPRVISTLRDLLRVHGGIRVYRNGFRVPPYGEGSDDWLALDASYRQRQLLVPHGNNNFFGFVELDDPNGEQFEETSSREGLLHNDAFDALVDFTARAIRAAVVRVNEARGVKITAGQRDWTQRPSATDRLRSATRDLAGVVDRLDAAAASSPTDVGNGTAPAPDAGHGVPSTPSAPSTSGPREGAGIGAGPVVPAGEIRAVLRDIEQAAADQEAERQELLQELGMLRILASLGITIGEFTHEIRQYLPAIQADAASFATSSPDEGERLMADRLRENVRAFATYASYFDTAVSDTASRQLRAVEMRAVLAAFVRTIDPALRRSGIPTPVPEYIGYRLYACPMHMSEWASILFNFFTNARKAIRRAGVPGRLQLRAGRANGAIFVEFADNGDGVPPENSERIFNPFFTTSAPARRADPAHEDVTGTGLGLKIVRDIVTGYGGRVFLATPPAEFTTCFRVEVPEATSEEIAEGDY